MRFPVGGGAGPFMDIIQFRQSGLRTRCFGGCRSIPRQSPTTLPGKTGPITKRDVLELEIAVVKTAPNMEFVPPRKPEELAREMPSVVVLRQLIRDVGPSVGAGAFPFELQRHTEGVHRQTVVPAG